MQDEAQINLHPSLGRVWTKRGRGNQRKIQAPGNNEKMHAFGATDWRNGATIRRYSLKRDSGTFCDLVDDCVARSRKRKRRTIMVVDNCRIHTPEGATKVRSLIAKHGKHLTLVYLPRYAPELMPQEAIWRVWRSRVTHNHKRLCLADLQQDSETCFEEWANDPNAVLQIISSPFRVRVPKEPKPRRFI